jgi:IS30 family transposase
MLRKEDLAVIKALKKCGVYQKDIAAQLGVHPKTVSRALRPDRSVVHQRKPRGSKLDPHRASIDRLLAEGVWNAVVIPHCVNDV